MVLEWLVAWWSAGRHGWALAATIAIAISVCTSARAVDLKVDFGVADVPEFISTSPNDVQAGFSDFSVDATQDGIAGILDLAASEAGVTSRAFSGVTVGIEPLDDEPLLFDGPDESDPLGDLIEDGLLHDGAVRLINLPAGAYEMTTYHYLSELLLVGVAGNSVDIFLDTGSGESLVAADVSPELEELVTVPIPFTADGTNDVVVRLSGEGPWINGFTLVPEPGSGVLLACGIGALLGGHWLRRRPRRT